MVDSSRSIYWLGDEDDGGIGRREKGNCRSQRLPDIVISSGSVSVGLGMR